MENKILIELVIPIMDKTYNVFVPVGKTVANITVLLEKSLIELSHGAFERQLESCLYGADGKQINPNVIVKESGLTNGSKVIII